MDVVQEAFVKAYRNLPKFEGTSGFYTWIYRITMNAAIDHLRKKNRAPSAEFEEGRGDHEAAIADPGPSLGVNAFEGPIGASCVRRSNARLISSRSITVRPLSSAISKAIAMKRSQKRSASHAVR